MGERQKTLRSNTQIYDLNVIGRVEGVTPPKQARSSAVLQRILGAMATLIEEKEFDEITIPQVAALAGCGMAAIYSRFKDKGSILAALHEHLRSRRLSLDELFSEDDWQSRSVEDNLRALVTLLVSYYSEHRNLVSATLLMRDEGCYKRVAMTISHISKMLFQYLKEHMPDTQVDELAVDMAVRAAFALLQQRLLFQSVSIGSKAPKDDAELIEQLTGLLLACAHYQKKQP